MSKEEPGESSASLAHLNAAWSSSVKRKSGVRERWGGGECVGVGGVEEQVVVVVKGSDEEGLRVGVFPFRSIPEYSRLMLEAEREGRWRGLRRQICVHSCV